MTEGMNFMDYSFLAILILSGLAGAYQGLVKMVVGFVSIFFTFFISIKFYPAVTHVLKTKTPIYRMLKESVASNMNSSLSTLPGVDTLTKLNDQIVNTVTDKIKVPPVLRSLIMKHTDVDLNHFNTGQLIDTLAINAADIFVKVMGFIILFATIQFIFTIVQNGLDAFFTLPILSEVNILGGFAVGVIQGIVTLFVICAAWSMLSGSAMYKEVFVDLNASKYAKWFYDHNMLLEILVKYKIL